jgi:hypothetical protein
MKLSPSYISLTRAIIALSLVCESMLLFIFVPMLLHLRHRNNPIEMNGSNRLRSNFRSDNVGHTRVSGVDFEVPCTNDWSLCSTSAVEFPPASDVMDASRGLTEYIGQQSQSNSNSTSHRSSQLQIVEEEPMKNDSFFACMLPTEDSSKSLQSNENDDVQDVVATNEQPDQSEGLPGIVDTISSPDSIDEDLFDGGYISA